MDTVIPFDFTALFALIGPLARKAKLLYPDGPKGDIFTTADDFIQGKRGTHIDEEIGNALFTIVDNLARTILKMPDFGDKERSDLKTLVEFTDYMKSIGIELESY